MICYIGAGFTNSYRPKHKFIKSCNFQLTNTYSVDKLAEHTALTAHEIFTVNKNGSGYEIILFPEPCLKLTKNVLTGSCMLSMTGVIAYTNVVSTNSSGLGLTKHKC